jgi:hypothetical protein
MVEQRSTKEMGFDLGCSSETITKLLIAFDIPIRSNAKVKRCREKLTVEFLRKAYCEDGRSTTDIGNEVGCSYNTVNRALREHKIYIRTNGEVRKEDLTGQTFGSWKVLKEAPIERNGGIHAFLCECVCGRQLRITPSTLQSGSSTRCFDCATAALAKTIIPGAYMGSLKASAFKRGFRFEVSAEYLADLYETQGRRCALTNARLNMAESNFRRSSMTASVDRIDSLGHYVPGNVQWVHKKVNTMKWDLDQADFINICHAVARLHPEPSSTILATSDLSQETSTAWDWSFPDPTYKNSVLASA